MVFRHVRILAVAVLAAAGSLWIAPPANAATDAHDAPAAGPMACIGQGYASYAPGLTLTPKPTLFGIDLYLGSCPTGDGVTSGRYQQGGLQPLGSCTANI